MNEGLSLIFANNERGVTTTCLFASVDRVDKYAIVKVSLGESSCVNITSLLAAVILETGTSTDNGPSGFGTTESVLEAN